MYSHSQNVDLQILTDSMYVFIRIKYSTNSKTKSLGLFQAFSMFLCLSRKSSRKGAVWHSDPVGNTEAQCLKSATIFDQPMIRFHMRRFTYPVFPRVPYPNIDNFSFCRHYHGPIWIEIMLRGS